MGYEGVLSFETAPVLSAFPEVMKADTLAFIAKIGTYFKAKSQHLPVVLFIHTVNPLRRLPGIAAGSFHKVSQKVWRYVHFLTVRIL